MITMDTKIVFLFPGQGVQYPGMLSGDGVAELVNEASDILHKNVASFDTQEIIKHTWATQVCLLICATACARALIKNGISPDMVCGLSIGAYPAAVTAGVLAFEDALKLVYRRGQLMEEAYPQGYGMTAVIGLDLHTVTKLCNTRSDVYVANYNSETQIVIAGKDEAMSEISELCLKRGASRCHRLKIAVPSHCPLLNDAAKKLAESFEGVLIKRPKMAYMSASSARVLWDPEKIKHDLITNMAVQTKWHEAMISANERGIELALEMPPGSVLSGLTKSAFSKGEALSLEQNGLTKTIDYVHFRTQS